MLLPIYNVGPNLRAADHPSDSEDALSPCLTKLSNISQQSKRPIVEIEPSPKKVRTVQRAECMCKLQVGVGTWGWYNPRKGDIPMRLGRHGQMMSRLSADTSVSSKDKQSNARD